MPERGTDRARRVPAWAGVAITTLITALIAALIAAGCGQPSGPDAHTAVSASAMGGRVVVDADGIATLDRLYDGFGFVFAQRYVTVAEMAARMPVVITGTVDAVLPGRSTVVEATESSGGLSERDSTILIRVKVTDRIKIEAAGAVTDGFAYLSMPRAVNDIDAHGEVVGPDLYPSVEELQEAIPVGARVAVASQPNLRRLEPVERVETDPNPLPEGAVILVGYGQGVIYDRGPEVALDQTTWGGLTFDDVLGQLAG